MQATLYIDSLKLPSDIFSCSRKDRGRENQSFQSSCLWTVISKEVANTTQRAGQLAAARALLKGQLTTLRQQEYWPLDKRIKCVKYGHKSPLVFRAPIKSKVIISQALSVRFHFKICYKFADISLHSV